MYIAVCDDLAEELNRIDSLLRVWEAERHFPLRRKLFPSVVELLESARQERFSLYLLDVIMPGTSGIDAARELRASGSTADIVFLTSSPEFACDSYRVQALDYLLKPVDRELLFSLLDRLYLRELRPEEALVLKTGVSVFRIPFSQLSFVEVMDKRLYFHMASGETREIFGSMNDYESQLLSRPEFMRSHRSYIVNLRHVAEVFPSCIRTLSGKKVPVSRRLYPQIQKGYFRALFEGGDVR